METKIKQDLDLAIQSLKSAFFVCDLQMNILMSNKTLNQFIRSSQPDLIGSNLLDLVDLEIHSECIKALRKTVTDGITRTLIEKGLDFDQRIKCEISKIGEVLLVEIIDVSDFQKQNEKRIQYEELLIRKEQITQIQKFAQGIAHDFGNISQSIRGFTELLTNVVEDENGKKILDNLLISTNRALKVSKKISEISRIQILENSDLNLVRFLKEHLETLEKMVNSDVRIEMHLPNPEIEERLEVFVNQEQIERIVENIIENANHAMSGSGRIDIYCFPDSNRSNFILKIKNDGPAIPRNIAERIFMPFVTNGKTGGTGLGLYLAFEYLTSCGGHIKLENQNHDVSFIITLPIITKAKISKIKASDVA